MLATQRAVLADSGMRNYLRRIPPNSALHVPGLDYDNWYIGTVLDYSGEHNHGTITGVTWARLPSGLWYLDFADLQYINCGTGASLNITGVMSAYLWMNPTDKANYGVVIARLDNPEGNNIQYLLTVDNTADTLNYYNSAGAWKLSTFTVDYGVWGLYGFTYDGTNVSLMKNGVIEAGQAVGAPVSQAAYQFLINASWSGTPRYGLGGKALLRVKNTVTSASQFLDVYQQERDFFGV